MRISSYAVVWRRTRAITAASARSLRGICRVRARAPLPTGVVCCVTASAKRSARGTCSGEKLGKRIALGVVNRAEEARAGFRVGHDVQRDGVTHRSLAVLRRHIERVIADFVVLGLEDQLALPFDLARGKAGRIRTSAKNVSSNERPKKVIGAAPDAETGNGNAEKCAKPSV